MVRVNPKALYDPSRDLTVYEDVPLDPKPSEGPRLLFAGEFDAVLLWGREKDDKAEPGMVEWLLKLGIRLPVRGGPPILGWWFCRIKQKHAGLWASLMAILPIDHNGSEMDVLPEQFIGTAFKLRVGPNRRDTALEPRLWPQRFFRTSSQHPQGQPTQPAGRSYGTRPADPPSQGGPPAQQYGDGGPYYYGEGGRPPSFDASATDELGADDVPF